MEAFVFGSPGSQTIIFLVTLGVLVLQLVLAACCVFSVRLASNQREKLHQELFGLMKRIEGLSAGKRALITYQFDNMLESLGKQLPTRIASEAGQRIFDTESQILKALSEIEPALGDNKLMHTRLEQVVHSMENLEATVVSVTCESVRQAIVDVRHSLLAPDEIETNYHR